MTHTANSCTIGVITQLYTGGSKMSHYTHFTTEEREESRVLKAQGFSIRGIAKKLKRSPSSISREFKRNSYANGEYKAFHADKLYKKRRKKCGRQHLLKQENIRAYVLEKMYLYWTPEQISGRCKVDKKSFGISFTTIYRAIDSGVLPQKLKKIMRFKWKRKKCKTIDKRGKIPDTISIHDRPAGAKNRSRFGHWESDTVLGQHKTGCFGTHAERKSGFLVAFRIDDRRDNAFNKATIKAFQSVPEKLKKSFTVDNGKEFASHKELSDETGMPVYFCDPYSPWQRGTNENTNGLLRQFFPKGTSFSHISDEDLAFTVGLINNRPRKRLGFLTPMEVLNKFFS